MAESVSDGTTDFNAGMNAWNHPDAIAPTQYWKGVNIDNRGSYLGPRPGFHEVELTFEPKFFTSSYVYQRSYEEFWFSGKFQAMIPFDRGPTKYVLTVVNGYVWKTDLSTGYTELLSLDIFVQPNVARANWSYADDAVVIFDYPAYPIIIEETKIFRSDTKYVPVATLGAYNSNRLFIANAGVEYTAGDAVGNLATPDAPLTFDEVFTPSSPYFQEVFSLPVGEALSPITAMGFIPQLDNSTGVGPLFLSTANKIYYAQAQQPRAQWTQTSDGFCKLFINNSGIAGQRAFVAVGSDLIYFSADNRVHSFSNSRNEAARWSNIGMSREVQNYLDTKEKSLSQFAVCGYYDNRILVTANPYRVPAIDKNGNTISDYAHGGFVVLDISHVATFLQEGSPAWSGLWTGVRPMDICNVGSETYIMSKDGASQIGGRNRIYRIDSKKTYDVISKKKRYVRSILYTREYNFNTGFNLKEEGSIELQMENVGGKLDVNIEQKPSHINRFLQHTHWQHTAPITSSRPNDVFVNGIDSQSFRQIIFGDGSQKECNPVTKERSVPYRSIQYRVTISAETWNLLAFKTNAYLIATSQQALESIACQKLTTARLPKQCDPDWLIPEGFNGSAYC